MTISVNSAICPTKVLIFSLPSLESASLVRMSRITSSAAFLLLSASLRTSVATTANPRPCSPARAASTAALSARMLVCSAMSFTYVMRDETSLSALSRLPLDSDISATDCATALDMLSACCASWALLCMLAFIAPIACDICSTERFERLTDWVMMSEVSTTACPVDCRLPTAPFTVPSMLTRLLRISSMASCRRWISLALAGSIPLSCSVLKVSLRFPCAIFSMLCTSRPMGCTTILAAR